MNPSSYMAEWSSASNSSAMLLLPKVSNVQIQCMLVCSFVLMDGWVRVLHPFQQYFSHFEMMEGWTSKALRNEVTFMFGKTLASSGIQTCDCSDTWSLLFVLRFYGTFYTIKVMLTLFLCKLPQPLTSTKCQYFHPYYLAVEIISWPNL